jgi:hypothetical protein
MGRARNVADRDFAGVRGPLLSRIPVPLRSPGVADGDITHAARAFRSAVHGVVVLEWQRQFAMGASVEKSFERMLDLLVGGFGAWMMRLPG